MNGEVLGRMSGAGRSNGASSTSIQGPVTKDYVDSSTSGLDFNLPTRVPGAGTLVIGTTVSVNGNLSSESLLSMDSLAVKIRPSNGAGNAP